MAHTEHGDDHADLVGRVVEEYFERSKRGENPSLEGFVARYPEIADLLQTVIPGLQVTAPPLESDRSHAPEIKSLGDFNILGEVGRGGMGVVYEAEQVSLERRVALKVLIHHASASKTQRRRFQREARSAACLHHTNIVPVFGVGEEGDIDYYVMQLIHGKGLDVVLKELRHLRSGIQTPGDNGSRAGRDTAAMSLIAHSLLRGDRQEESNHLVDVASNRNGSVARHQAVTSSGELSSGSFSTSSSSLSVAGPESSSQTNHHANYWGSVARTGLQVARALQYAHDHSILHRDIKPSNLILDTSGTVWVSDFGLAKVMDQQELTNTGDLLGTLRYMPPEAFHGETDQRSDIYSLGITLYEMLVLRPAYEEVDRHRLIALVAGGTVQRLEQVDPAIPRDLVTIIHKSIETDPTHRYQSAKEMEDDFAKFLADQPIMARPISPMERTVRWTRRNRGMAISLAAVALLLIFGTVASMLFAVHSRSLKEAAEYNQYVSYIFATNYRTEKDSRSAVLARMSLAATPAKFRNWEWAYLANKVWPADTPKAPRSIAEQRMADADFWKLGTPVVDQEIVPQYGTGTGIMTGKYNADGTQLVLTLGDGFAGLHSLTTNRAATLFRRPNATFYDMTLSPDGEKLVTSELTGRVIIYDASTGEELILSPEGHTVAQATWIWSPCQKYVVSLHADPTIRIWDASTLDPKTVVVIRKHDSELRSLETSDIRFEEDELWAAAIDGTITKWSFPKGEFLNTIKAPIVAGMIHHAISPDGRTAVATFEDGSSILWNLDWQTETVDYLRLAVSKQSAGNMRGTPAAFAPDGTCVAVMNDLLTATIYDVSSGDQLCTIDGHSTEVRSVEFSPDGKSLLTVSDDGTAKIWSQRAQQDRDELTFANAHTYPVFQIDFDPQGTRLLSGSFDGIARVWDVATQRIISTHANHTAPIVAVDFDAQGDRAASLDADGVLHVWDPATGDLVFAIDPQSDRFSQHIRATSGRIIGDILYFPGSLSTGLFSPDGAHVVTFQKDCMKVFRANDGVLEATLTGSADHGWPVFNRDSTLITVLEMDARKLRVWDLQSGLPIRSYPLQGVHATAMSMVGFSPIDDRVVSGDMGGTILIRDARSGQLLHELKTEFGVVASCRFSVDGKLVFTGHNNGMCCVWDARSGKMVTTLTGHLGAIRDVRMSPDGSRLLSWSVDDKAVVWDLAQPAANQLVVLTGESRLLQAHWSPNGRSIASAWSDGSLGIWSGASKNDLAALPSQLDDLQNALPTWRKNLTTASRH